MGGCDPRPSLTRAEIDLAALAHNWRELRRVTAPRARLMAVVKADAYGHGAVPVSRVALATGVDFLAVAWLSEAVHLRKAGIAVPILLFGHTPPGNVACMAAHDIRASVTSLESAAALAGEASRQNQTLTVHVKVDTGMGRLGLVADPLLLPAPAGGDVSRVAGQILDITRLPHLHVEGIYTHFAKADSRDKGHAREQLTLFLEVLAALQKHSFEPEIRHAANSAATIEMPETHLDLVRIGIAQYGLWPSAETDRSLIDLKPVMSIRSAVVQLKDVPPGFRVSYGCTWASKRHTKIATIPIGYADGFNRLLSSRGCMLVRGQRAPVAGRVCMDLTMLDVGHLTEVEMGDEVVVLGAQGGEHITAEEIAQSIGTINYEVVTSVTARVPRVYRS